MPKCRTKVDLRRFEPKRTFRNSNGAQTEYIFFDRGKERTTVFVPGWALRLSCWKYQMRDERSGLSLFPDHNLLFLNNRGHGNVPLNGSNPSTYLTDCAQDISELMKFLELGRVQLVAHSMGALLVATLYALESDKIGTITLVCPTPGNPLVSFPLALKLGKAYDIITDVVKEEWVVQATKLFLGQRIFPHLFPPIVKYYYREFVRITGSAVSFDTFRKYLESVIVADPTTFMVAFRAMVQTGNQIGEKLRLIRCPTLAVVGENDFLVSSGYAGAELKRMIPGVQIEIFDRTTHFPMAERSVRFNRTLGRFIESHESYSKPIK